MIIIKYYIMIILIIYSNLISISKISQLIRVGLLILHFVYSHSS